MPVRPRPTSGTTVIRRTPSQPHWAGPCRSWMRVDPHHAALPVGPAPGARPRSTAGSPATSKRPPSAGGARVRLGGCGRGGSARAGAAPEAERGAGRRHRSPWELVVAQAAPAQDLGTGPDGGRAGRSAVAPSGLDGVSRIRSAGSRSQSSLTTHPPASPTYPVAPHRRTGRGRLSGLPRAAVQVEHPDGRVDDPVARGSPMSPPSAVNPGLGAGDRTGRHRRGPWRRPGSRAPRRRHPGRPRWRGRRPRHPSTPAGDRTRRRTGRRRWGSTRRWRSRRVGSGS